MNDIEYLRKLFLGHRKKAYITCDEHCFCWPVERMLNDIESELEDGPDIFEPCIKCAGTINEHVGWCPDA